MTQGRTVAQRLEPLLTRVLGDRPPVRIRAWDGSEVGADGAPTFVISDRRALRRLLWKPGEIGLARAYVAGELDVDGDLLDALAAVFGVLQRSPGEAIRLSAADKAEIVRTAVMLGAVGPEPPPPEEELHLRGTAAAGGDGGLRTHLAPPSDYFAVQLGGVMTYSAGVFEGRDIALDVAQRAAFADVAARLDLPPGGRVLDVGCGWGALASHLAGEHGLRVVGITPVAEHAERARKLVAHAGHGDLVEIRTGDLAEVADGPFDGVVDITGAGEHLGADGFADHARLLYAVLRDGGRLVNTQIVRRPGKVPSGPTFTSGYVFPDGVLLTFAELIDGLEEASFEVRDATSRREDYSRTVRCWVDNLRTQWDECVRITADGAVRARLLYLAAAALALEAGRIEAHRVVAVRRYPYRQNGT